MRTKIVAVVIMLIIAGAYVVFFYPAFCLNDWVGEPVCHSLWSEYSGNYPTP